MISAREDVIDAAGHGHEHALPRPTVDVEYGAVAALRDRYGGFRSVLASMVRANLRAPDPIAENAPSRWSDHGPITAALAAAGNAAKI
jgi:hypothetical protein